MRFFYGLLTAFSVILFFTSQALARLRLSFIFTLAIALSALANTPMSGRAATLVGSASFPTGVDGLVVDGTTYNVTFTQGSYNTVFGTNDPTFLNNFFPGATFAAGALADALNAQAQPFNAGFFSELIPTSAGSGSFNSIRVFQTGTFPFGIGLDNGIAVDATLVNNSPTAEQGFAVFTQVTAVPEPST